MISSGNKSISLHDIYKVTSDAEIVYYYLGVSNIPCRINSPLRRDNNPSFGLFSPDGNRITYIDFSTKERGNIFDLLGKMWNLDFSSVLYKIYTDFTKYKGKSTIQHTNTYKINKGNNNIALECRTRKWRNYDLVYWNSYGISLRWLKYADVYPISHKIIIKDGRRMVFGADKYAYAYVEFKDGKTTLKIYQPFNKKGYKWCNKHDKSVISLWTKVPKNGDKICICSSLKDALCLWANIGIPSLAIQGEGYSISNTAINNLKSRYKNIYILLDNDAPGLKDGVELAKLTGFTNIVLPNINGAKDISDLYQSLKDKKEFQSIINKLFI
jgi:hypothetical protein